MSTMMVRLFQMKFGRWIILHPDRNDLAWSGSRWVPIDENGFPNGDVQVSNLMTALEAVRYAQSFGFTPLILPKNVNPKDMEFVHIGDPKVKQLAGMVVSTEQAPGAIPNGSKIKKVNSSADDGHRDGDQATVIGSLGPAEIQGRKAYGYFVVWDDTPEVPCFIAEFRIERV